MTSAQLGQLGHELNTTLYTDAKVILAWLLNTFEVAYSRSGLTELLHRLRFTYKLTTPVLCQANAAAQEDSCRNWPCSKRTWRRTRPSDAHRTRTLGVASFVRRPGARLPRRGGAFCQQLAGVRAHRGRAFCHYPAYLAGLMAPATTARPATAARRPPFLDPDSPLANSPFGRMIEATRHIPAPKIKVWPVPKQARPRRMAKASPRKARPPAAAPTQLPPFLDPDSALANSPFGRMIEATRHIPAHRLTVWPVPKH